MKVSIVIPLYNEEKIIEENSKELVKFMESLGHDFEIILVENGSTDKTLEKGKAVSREEPRVRMLSIPQRDMGRGIRKGVLESTGDYVTLFALDFDIKTDFIERSLKAVKDFDMIVGSKNHPDSKVFRPKKRGFLSFAYGGMVNLLFSPGVSDTQCVKTFRSKPVMPLAKETISGGIIWELELVYLARKAGLRVKEFPVNVEDMSKGSRIRLSDMAKAFLDLLSLRLALWKKSILG